MSSPTSANCVQMWGTGPLLRVYAEAASPALVEEILARAEELVRKSDGG